jgi:hypothetical protein
MALTLPAASQAAPVLVAEADKAQWWHWVNAPAVNIEAERYFSYPVGTGMEAELQYTIRADGSVANCTVARKTDPEQSDDRICALIALHEYAPATGNAARTPIRTSFSILIGVTPERADELTRDAADR